MASGFPAVVVTDIEGTTTPIAFVHRVLFPHARQALPALVRQRAAEVLVADALAEIAQLAPGCDPVTQLLAWMDADAKITPLKTLQGLTWRDGYRSGLLLGELYPDVAPALRRWHRASIRLAIYSSGSEEAQRLLVAHSRDGDLSLLFDAYFDTRLGAKRDRASYAALVRRLEVAPGSVLFLSDVVAELDAASAAGLLTCQLVRPEDGTQASTSHPVAASFDAVADRFGLPRADEAVPAAAPGA